MPLSMSLDERLMNFCIVYQSDVISCQVLTVTAAETNGSQPNGSHLNDIEGRRLLRNAEREARKLGILCSISSLSLQLWVFYREASPHAGLTEELTARHGLTFMDSLGLTFSISELLRDQYSELYQFFLSSILASLNLVSTTKASITILSPRTIAVHRKSSLDLVLGTTGYSPEFDAAYASIDLQLLDSCLVLSLRPLHGERLETVEHHLKTPDASDLTQSDVLLGPCGKLGRVKEWPPKSENGATEVNVSQAEGYRRSVWKDSARAWLSERGIEPSQKETWVELEIIAPLQRPIHTPSAGNERDLQMLHSILWPSSLVLSKVRKSGPKTDSSIAESHSYLDPLAKAEEWFQNSGARKDRVAKRKAAKIAEQVQRERTSRETAMRDDLPASSPTMIRPYSDSNVVTSIYPTPPDGPLSHITPGVSSIDGGGITPHDSLEAGPNPFGMQRDGDTEMTESRPNVGDDFYDDDLFEDDPGHVSESGEIDNDPDWDFFDEPGPEKEDIESGDGAMSGEATDFAGQDGIHNIKFSSKAQSMEVEQQENILESEDHTADVDAGNLVSATGPHPEPLADAQKIVHPSNEEHQSAVALNEPEDDKSIHPRERKSRRSSSASETENMDIKRPRDDKYTTQGGRFWFAERKNTSQLPSKRSDSRPIFLTTASNLKPATPKGLMATEQDNSSGMSMSPLSSASTAFDSSELFDEDDQPSDIWGSLRRQWATVPESPAPSAAFANDSERQAIEIEHFMLLDTLFQDSGQWPLDDWLGVDEDLASLRMPTKNDDQHNATLLFDQVSQSFLFQDLVAVSQPDKVGMDILDDISRNWQLPTPLTVCPSLNQLYRISGMLDRPEEFPVTTICEAPKIRLRRGGKNLEALPPLLSFWETLGLQPVGDKRDITAFCLYPDNSPLRANCEEFLAQLGHVYRECHLGDHTLGPSGKLVTDGFVPYTCNDLGMAPSEEFGRLCSDIGSDLAGVAASSTLVVYVVHPCPTLLSLREMCAALWTLFMSYAKATYGRQKSHQDLVFQLLPMPLILSKDRVAIPTQNDYFRLALEVYNRCGPPGSEPGSFSPAVLLTEQIKRPLSLSLTVDGISPLQRDNNSLHLSYSQTLDERWIVAAWTDNYGKKALTMSYCLRSRGMVHGFGRPISEIIKEMWRTTCDILSSFPGRQRIIVCREGCMSHAEANAWKFCLNRENSSSPRAALDISLVLLTFDTRPAFQLANFSSASTSTRRAAANAVTLHTQHTPTTANFSHASTLTAGVTYGTPVSTPTPSASQSMLSPEQAMTTGTPGTIAALTPTPSAASTSQLQPQHQQPLSQSPIPPGLRTNPSQAHVAHSQSQGQTPTIPSLQSQAEIQTVLETDPTSVLSIPGSQYTSILSPYPMKRSTMLSDKTCAIASAYLVRFKSDGELAGTGTTPAYADANPETVLGVDLIFSSTLEAKDGGSSNDPGNGTEPNTPSQRSVATDPLVLEAMGQASTSTNTSPAKSVGSQASTAYKRGQVDLQPSQVECELVQRDIMPLFRNLITMSETRGLGYTSPSLQVDRKFADMPNGYKETIVLPWHIMMAVRGRKILEGCGI